MALPTSIRLESSRPDRVLVTEQVDEVQVPGAEGYFGVLPAMRRCSRRCTSASCGTRIGQDKHYLAVAFGFVEVLPDKVTILARIAEREGEIDRERAEAAMKRAEQRIGEPRTDIDFERARLAMMKSLIRLQVASRARTRA
jgi:F-type H+-transporting ATPase subunit epsilon